MRSTRRPLPSTPRAPLGRRWSHRPRQRLPTLQQLPRRRPPPRMGHHHGIRPTPLADPTRQHRPETPTRAVVSPAHHETRRHRSLTYPAPQLDSLHPARPGPHLLFENSIAIIPTRWSRCRVPVARNPFGTRGLEARRWRSSAPRPPGWGTARDSSIAGRGASRVRRASRPLAPVLDSDHRGPVAVRHRGSRGSSLALLGTSTIDLSERCRRAGGRHRRQFMIARIGPGVHRPVWVSWVTTRSAGVWSTSGVSRCRLPQSLAHELRR